MNGANARARGVVLAGGSAAPREGREAEAAAKVLSDLGHPAVVVGSANGTWIDRVEATGARLAGRRENRPGGPTLCSLRGRFAETFSVTPLLGVAAALLGPEPFSSREQPRGVLATDFTGTVAGAAVRAEAERP